MSQAIRRLIPISTAAAYLGGISKVTVYALINRGELKKVNVGRRSFVTAQSINDYIDRLEAQA
ncbi:helix-turn-helix transcriptional regulator [Nocardia fluminea]|uniref:helix-turn-helix transcriptional regulator n=1 Tax=Nocardia fluminea TaxID=134984 RepID=UPI0033C06E03